MEHKSKVLVVDDEERNLRLMEALLIPLGYQVMLAGDGEECLEMVRQSPPDLILLDIQMPKLNGFEVARRLKEEEDTRIIPIVMVTALTEMEDRVKAIEAGADDFLGKPVDKTELLARVRSLLKVKAYHDHMREYQKVLEAEVAKRTVELKEALEKIEVALENTVSMLATTVEMKDPYTAGHQERVSQIACAIAQEMGLPKGQVEGLRIMGYLHDIGKIMVPGEILSKPGILKHSELSLIKDHCQAGYEILKKMEFPWPVAQAILQHHERLDGSGYPLGLTGKEIILEARILGVADVMEATSFHRPYRPAKGPKEGLRDISENSGVLYDPEVVEACVELFTKKNFTFRL